MQIKIFDFVKLLRLEKPVGIFLLYLPCAFAISLYKPENQIFLYIIFFVGSVVMRSAGCVINDILDKDFDKYVERTKNRPIAAGKISILDAFLILFLLFILGLMILIQLNLHAILSGIFVAPLVIIYPVMKRITYFPQLFLGVIFNFGIIIVTLEIYREITIYSLILYFGAIFWTLTYDTIYGFMDIDDDKKIGVKSLTIILEKRNYRLYLSVFLQIFTFSLLFSKFFFEESYNLLIFLLWLIITIFMQYQIITFNPKDKKSCLILFKFNIYIGSLWAFFLYI